MKNLTNLSIIVIILAITSSPLLAASGKLVGTAGLSQVEGAGGGGIVPWAILSGYDSRDEISFSAAATQVNIKDYKLNTYSASASFYDRIEVSFAHQKFELKSLGGNIKQNIIGAKYRIYGDAVFSNWPQLSIGVQHKRLDNGAVAKLVGAKNSHSGTDIYIAASKIHLGAIAGYNAIWNVTARATKANEMGLLGFGSISNDNYDLMLEASAGILFSRHVAVGIEYRQKPDNLGLGESDWKDYFISYIPNKHLSLTLAWAELGTIAGAEEQDGVYFSIAGHL